MVMVLYEISKKRPTFCPWEVNLASPELGRPTPDTKGARGALALARLGSFALIFFSFPHSLKAVGEQGGDVHDENAWCWLDGTGDVGKREQHAWQAPMRTRGGGGVNVCWWTERPRRG